MFDLKSAYRHSQDRYSLIHVCKRSKQDQIHSKNIDKLNLQVEYIKCSTQFNPIKIPSRRNRTLHHLIQGPKTFTKSIALKRNIQNQFEIKSVSKKVSLQFDIQRRKKSAKMRMLTQENQDKVDYLTMITNSMKKYMNKVDRSKQLKLAKNSVNLQFGLGIKKISSIEETMDKYIKDQHYINKSKGSLHKSSIQLNNNITANKKKKLFIGDNHIKNIKQFSDKKNLFQSKQLKKKSKQQQNSFEGRLQRLMHFLSIVLYSYGCYQQFVKISFNSLNKTLKSIRPNKYSYYVGAGNNKNLIISLLKKRWWWVQTSDINSANFVWTQLRVDSISQKHTKICQYELQQPDLYNYKNQQNLQSKKQQQFFKKAALKLFHSSFSNKFHTKLRPQQQKRILRQLKPPSILHNHYQTNCMLGNKKALFHNLTLYCTYSNKQLFELIPQTFHLKNTNQKAWEDFQKYFTINPNTLWIVKPGQNSNRGKGIFLADSLRKIKSLIKQKQNQHTYIIQKYVKDVLLFQRRKFDIRMYLLLVTIGGQSKFFWYPQGYLRTCSQIYTTKDINNVYIHLTNDAIQYNSDNYGKYQDGNKISFHQFERYLTTTYQSKYNFKQLIQNMKNIAKVVVHSIYNKIDPQKRVFGVELFGMDFLVTQNFKPLLLEVNTNPCLEFSSTHLERLLPRLLQNMFKISLDTMFSPNNQCPRTSACFIPENVLERNRFELIFDSLFDRDFEWQTMNICNPTVQLYQDDDEQYEDDGELITLQNF